MTLIRWGDRWAGRASFLSQRAATLPPPITYPETAVRSERRIQVRRLPELAGIAAVLVLAAALNLVRLSREGYANQYYAAAVKSMLTSWHNFFFVSFDAGGFVTVDKPPLGFWIQAASAKLFGFHGWSILLPEAVAGVLRIEGE